MLLTIAEARCKNANLRVNFKVKRTMKIGELASRLGIPPSTIRYYEQIGLLKPPVRSANGYRRYSEESEVRIRQIQVASKLGFPLDAVRTLFTADGRSAKTRASEQIALRLREIEALQAALQRQHQDLSGLLKNLDGAGCAAQDVGGVASASLVGVQRRSRRQTFP